MRFCIVVAQYKEYNFNYPPYGAMYVGAALMTDGHEVKIIVGNDFKEYDLDGIVKEVVDFAPDAIGISAVVATSYRFVKDLSRRFKDIMPNIKQVVGGGLTASVEIVLKNTAIDFAVIGEGEETIKELVKGIEGEEHVDAINGIALERNGDVHFTERRRPVARLDALPYPAFDLINMNQYLVPIHEYLGNFRSYREQDRRFNAKHYQTRMIRIPTARGCTSRCSFCYRHMRGIRQFSLEYLFRYIEFVMEKFGVRQFSFGDECFSPSKRWTRKFVAEMRRRKIDIMFQILGMRVDTVDREILADMKAIGCWMIEYGFETGSQKMLNVINKKVSVADNINVARWTREAGIYTSPALVIGMPGEDRKTIEETTNFLIEIDYDHFQYTYAFPVPGTPLFEYARLCGLIVDEEEYLDSIYDVTPNNYVYGKCFVNFTDSGKVDLLRWPMMIQQRLDNRNGKARIQSLWLKTMNAYKYIRRDGLAKFVHGYITRKCDRVKMFQSEKIGKVETEADKTMKQLYNQMIPNQGISLHQINRAIQDQLHLVD